jgi:quinol monooxygenase YgiN
MSGLYTSGDWNVKHGEAESFIEAWSDLAEWTIAHVAGCTFAKLLRDDADPQRFLSFSPWRDAEAVNTWRELPGFAARVEQIQPTLVTFDPRTMNIVAEAGTPTPDPWHGTP